MRPSARQCLCQVSRNAPKHITQIFGLWTWSIHCSLFYHLWLEAGWYFFFLRLFQYFVFMAEFVLCKYVMCFFHSLPKQMFVLDKIFTTVSSTHFGYTCCYNQHKKKFPRIDYKATGDGFTWSNDHAVSKSACLEDKSFKHWWCPDFPCIFTVRLRFYFFSNTSLHF